MQRPRQYFGGDVGFFRSDAGLCLSEVDYASRKWSPHTHKRAFFALLLRGHYLENLRDRQLSYRPFDLGFHPEATRHDDQIEAGARFFLVELDEEWLRRVRECQSSAACEPRMCAPRDACIASRLYRECRSSGMHAPLTESLVLELLAGLLTGTGCRWRDRPRWLRLILELLQDEPPRKLSLAAIAQEVGLHPVYVSRAFRELTGQTVSERLTELRIRYAVRQLAVSDAPLTDIALAAGFADQSHFTRIFKRETGTTPAAFRKVAARD